MMKAIVSRDLTVSFDRRIALDSVSFDVRMGEFLGVVGPNGSGKTTLLKAILGLVRPERGSIQVLGMDLWGNLTKVRREIAYVPQKERVNPKLPILVRDVVMMGRYGRIGVLRWPSRRDYDVVVDALEAVEMLQHVDEPFGHLSGGQQQRILIARAIAQEPKILLLDEPTSALDMTSQSAVIDLIDALRREKGLTVVMVTHDVNSISSYVDEVMYLRGGLVAKGPIESVCKLEILKQVYGPDVKVLRHEGRPCVIVSDHHA